MRTKLIAFVICCALTATALAQDSSGTPNYQRIADALRAIADEVAKMGPPPVNPPPVNPPPVNPPPVNPPPVNPPPVNPPPSGKQTPILNDARIALLKQLQSNNAQEWQRIKMFADATSSQYDDNGRAAAIVYRVTGDKSYAQKSYTLLMASLNSAGVLNANNVREYFLEFLLIDYWIRDALTADQQTAFESQIFKWSDFALGRNQDNANLGGFRPGDSDQTIGQYFGLAFMDAIGLGPGNLLQQTSGGPSPTPVGGLKATASDFSTARNAIGMYCSKLAHGGTWMESCEYNSNTVVLLIMGWEAMYDVYGIDYFPEIATWAVSGCDAALTSYTPDFASRLEWGDDERGGQLDWFEQFPYLAAMQHVAARTGHMTQAGHIGQMLDKMATIATGGAVRQRYYYYVDHTIPSLPYYDGKGPLANYSDGVGLYSRFDGGSLFAAFCPSSIGVDHENGYVADLMLYSGGEWVLKHPIGYGGNANTAYGVNAVLVSGLSAMSDKGPIACTTTSDYAYYAGQTSGRYYGPWKTANPAGFCKELTRSVLYLPKLNVIAVCDRVDSVEPASVLPDGNMWIYYQNDKDLMNAEAAKGPGHRHQVNWHMPVVPTIATVAAGGQQPFDGVSVTWQTSGKQQMQIASYATTGPLKTDIYDDRQFMTNAVGQQVRVHPDADREWDVFLSIVTLNSEVQPKAAVQGSAAGWTVGDTTIYFGIDQAGRLIDPASVTASGNTYLVGCSGSADVVVK